MSEPGDRLDRAYRSLAREEPPASLDATILAAAHRAVARPSAARRWGVPVSLAALLVLAVGVTLEMQHGEPGIETSAPGVRASVSTGAAPDSQPAPTAQPAPHEPPQAQAAPRARSAAEAPALLPAQQAKAAPEAPAKPREPQRASPAIDEERRRKDVPAAPAPAVREAPAPRELPQPFAAAPPAAAPPAATAAAPSMPHAEQRLAAPPAANMAKRSAEAGAAADATTGATADAAAPDPRAELERIARLRAAGEDAQADRALERFRKRYPDYRIDDATWQRVKPR